MSLAQCLLKVTLITCLIIVCAGGNRNARSRESSQQMTTATNSTAGRLQAEKQSPSSQGVSSPLSRGRRPPAAGFGAGCRKRVICEVARTLTHVVPVSSFWQEIMRGKPEPKSAYFAALSEGLSSRECWELYPDCSDGPAGMVLPMLSEVLGPNGFVTSFLERMEVPSAPHVPRDTGAPRPSLVMQKLRESQLRWQSKKSQTSS